MITQNQYELAYNLYINERYLNISNTSLEIKSVKESTDILEEGAKENIQNFIKKIVTGVQNAWNKFKAKVNDTKLKYAEDEIAKAIAALEPNITVEDYADYDVQALENVTIKELAWTIMQANLTDTTTFMKANYASFYRDESKSIKDNLKNHCIKSRTKTYKITRNDLLKMFDFVKGYKESVSKMEADLDAINKATNAASTVANTIAVNVESTNDTGYKLSKLNETISQYFSEADDPKPKIKNEEQDQNNNQGQDNKDKSSDIEKKVQLYFKCTSEILSAKLSLNREIYFFFNSVIDRHMINWGKSSIKDKVTSKKVNNDNNSSESNNTSTPQIKK